MKQKFKLVTAFLCGAIFFSSVGYAASELNVRVVDYKIVVNGEVQKFSNSPIIVNGSTYLPLRSIAESLGLNVGFNNGTVTIAATNIIEATPTPQPTLTPTPTPIATVKPTSTSNTNDTYVKIKAESERHNLAVQKIEADYKKVKDIINEKITQIRRESPVGYLSDYEYTNKLTSLQNEAQTLNNKIAVLSMDNSREAESQRKELQGKLNAKEKEITDLQTARSAQIQIRALEDQLKIYTDEYYSKLNSENLLHKSNLSSIN